MIDKDELRKKNSYSFDDLINLMKVLRKECPWDKKQTHKTLKSAMLEEAYEAIEAINKEDQDNLSEELGDVLLQVLFHAEIASEEGAYDINDIMTKLANKLIYRHPHIFSDVDVKSSEDVNNNWEKLKKKEKNQTTYTQQMVDVAVSLPALIRAKKVQTKAANIGFDMENVNEMVKKAKEELEELENEISSKNIQGIEEEIGDMLFSIVNISRFFKLNPEFTLTNTVEKFINRFRYIENFALRTGKDLNAMTLDEMDTLWNEAKYCTRKY